MALPPSLKCQNYMKDHHLVQFVCAPYYTSGSNASPLHLLVLLYWPARTGVTHSEGIYAIQSSHPPHNMSTRISLFVEKDRDLERFFSPLRCLSLQVEDWALELKHREVVSRIRALHHHTSALWRGHTMTLLHLSTYPTSLLDFYPPGLPILLFSSWLKCHKSFKNSLATIPLKLFIQIYLMCMAALPGLVCEGAPHIPTEGRRRHCMFQN